MKRQIREKLEEEYGIEAIEIEKVKGSYKINNIYGLKVVKYDYPHFKFIISAIEHLEKRTFRKIPYIIETKNKRKFIKINERYCYLTKWIEEARVSNFEDMEELEKIGTGIAELHKSSSGFIIPKGSRPRIYWGSWIKVFETRRNEIFDFKNRITQKAYRDSFDKIYLDNFIKEIEVANKAIERLEKSKYRKLMESGILRGGFCHHDLANHNILIDKKGDVNFIDFDYCILDSNLHDLASILWRVNKIGQYKKEKGEKILEGYKKIIEVTKEEEEVMKGFLMFPNEFWQIGLQRYWEQQPWEEEFMIDKLEKYLMKREEKEVLIEELNI